MGGIDPVVLIVALIFVLVGGIFWFMRQITLKDAWSGTIQDKVIETTEDSDGNTSEWYYFHVQLDGGDVVKKRVSRKIYEHFVIGDKAVKVAGQMNPVKQ